MAVIITATRSVLGAPQPVDGRDSTFGRSGHDDKENKYHLRFRAIERDLHHR